LGLGSGRWVLRAKGSRLRVWVYGFKSSLGFRVFDFEFQVSGLWFRIYSVW